MSNIGRDYKGNVRLSVDWPTGAIKEAEDLLSGIPGALQRAEVAAINLTVRNGKTALIRGLFQRLTLKQSEISRRVTSTNATPGRMSAYINLQRAQFKFDRFKYREDRRKKGWGTAASGTGTYVTIFRGGSEQQLPHAFVADAPVRGRTIFERTTKGPGSDRLKLFTRKAVNVAEIFWSDSTLGKAVVERMEEQFENNLFSRVKYELSKRGN